MLEDIALQSQILRRGLAVWGPNQASGQRSGQQLPGVPFAEAKALAASRAHAALATITLPAIDQPIIDAAGELEPVELRSLDALHLATIVSLREAVERVSCYDARLTHAARAIGIYVSEPS